ncbi:TetR family transcriptional regulator [Streptomyces sp. SID5785]|uniref:TetR/AcrR family transcriptional regulator n=1 Tax=Streptomyces sp. SID5785 TaxID=2690309 RepID=UPI001360E298|nr:TetR/AcrR family transcriptional regulator [Streptomyces sp. SID5785]MZD04681.1 TetR family transcriptional regulator [Streptomyces sp. SID5785]MZD08450.1 TetR family transcriptional regulator [Streptomyces sp. SID5785]
MTGTPDGTGATAGTVTRRRARTRQRLLDAAFEVFAREGFGRTTVEQVCDRAGFTRGAFYSNFSSLDELFLALWEERSARMLDDLRAALAGVGARGPEAGVRAAVDATPPDEAWYRITAEFTAHALRTPGLRRVMAARERAIREALLPVFVASLDRLGRRVPDEEALGDALVAVHDGTAVQVLMQPGDPAVRDRRRALFMNVLNAYSTPRETP